MANAKKYYWLKLKKDFFKRHDIQIIEAMQNGKDYILFYLKLLVESVDHNGHLRFNDLIPYNEVMLATITNTNVDVVRSAMKVFSELQLLDILDDQTIYMTEVVKMTGGESYWAQQKRAQRVGHCPTNVLSVSNLSNQEKEIEKELEIDIDKYNKVHKTRFTPPTLQDVSAYCGEMCIGIDAQRFIDHYEANGWMVGRNKMKNWKAAVRNWGKNQFSDRSKGAKEPTKPRQNFSQNTISGMSPDQMNAIIADKARRKKMQYGTTQSNQ